MQKYLCGSCLAERDPGGRWAGACAGHVGGKVANLEGVPWEAWEGLELVV